MLYRLKQAASAGAWSTRSRDLLHFTSLPQQKAGHKPADILSPDASLSFVILLVPHISCRLHSGGQESVMCPAQLV